MMTSRAFLKRHMAIGALLVVLAAAGCGTGSDADASNPESAAATSPSPSLETAASAAPRSTAPRKPEATEEDSASSGENSADFESCDDGACEVSFSGSVEFPLSGADGQWTVEAAFEDDGVRVNLTKPSGLGGGGGLLYHPACTFAAHADGSGSLSCAEEGQELPEPGAGGIVVHLLERTDDTAVIQAILG
ncbi:hypothetical protein [Glycomyces tarimensis]